MNRIVRENRPYRICLIHLAAMAAFLAITGAAPVRPQTPAVPAGEPPVTAPQQPSETREVLAQGIAAIGAGGIDAARRAAIVEALRNAVEETAGVYVSAKTMTRNFQLVRDQVIVHADGYATPLAVVSEKVDQEEVHVTVRARVSLRPLAKQLQALNLLRAWRVHVSATVNYADGTNETIIAALEKSLHGGGVVVVSNDEDADILVKTTCRSGGLVMRQEHGANGAPALVPITRNDVSARMTFAQTGELIDILNTTAISHEHDRNDALIEAANNAAADLAPRLTDSLLLLPARDTQPIQLIVGALGGVGQAARFEAALRTLPSVTSVTRRRYENGSGLWEVEALADTQGEIADDLEENPALKPFRLAVLSQTMVKITASTDGVAPVFSTDIAPTSNTQLRQSSAPPFKIPRPLTPAPPRYDPRVSTGDSTAHPSAQETPNIARSSIAKTAADKSIASGTRGLFVYEGFDYPPDEKLNSQQGGKGWAVPWSMHGYGAPSVITATGLTYQNLKTTGQAFETPSSLPMGDDRTWNRSYGTPGEIIYISGLLRPLEEITFQNNRMYCGFGMGPVAFGMSTGDIHLGLLDTRNHRTALSTVLAQKDHTYFLVVRITFGQINSVVDLFINPSPGQALPARQDATLTARFTQLNEYSSGANIRCVFDEFRVGETYAEVAPIQ